MRTFAKWAAAIALAASALFLMRPKNLPHPRIPKETLFCQYRIIAKHDGRNMDCGTAVAIRSRQILTARHVIEEGDSYELDLFDEDGNEIRTIPVRLIATGEKMGLDLALLEADEDLPSLDLSLDDFDVGAWGYVVGCAHATCPYNVYVGVFASKRGPPRYPGLSQIAVTVPPGESGGGVYSIESHHLVGICIGSREGFTLFVPAKMIRKFLNSVYP